MSKTPYPAIHEPDCVIATSRGFVMTHRYIMFNQTGYGPHLCYWCKTPINWNQKSHYLTVDHVDWDIYNNDLKNLVVSCLSCNSRRHRPKPLPAHGTSSRYHYHRCRCADCRLWAKVYNPPEVRNYYRKKARQKLLEERAKLK